MGQELSVSAFIARM